MLIKNIMIPVSDLTTLRMTHTAKEALEVIDSKALLSLPVVDGKQFVGIISKRYILEEYFNSEEDKATFLKRPISDFMKTKIQCLSSEDLVEEPIKLLCNRNIQFIPVVDEAGHFAGIVTHKAVFATFKNALGIGYTRLAITTPDVKGRLAKLTELIAREKGNIISIVQLDPEVMHLKELIIRVEAENVQKLVKVLNENGFTVRRVD
ncbi:CBS domain-containing protein [Cellulosilyticum sp. ST5]|uniref:CBS domain containing protein n=1 Tax=Cellulosilyticum lentocellum (strain ATCC 49066 / DSM 5427 / NCIMB 11756 / RHM5) TaxID=642492 RepID=F2JHH7_CELLD|nr:MULTISPECIES: CBS domain-containing protein [Cellulosilyticum]ADZ84216.1 CBS domain containing protein [Cellulosilyticum lentocellum DSM 5427]QEH69661.1 CBS domain-containing protein [Cellulosilyticum sp. WCF-2]